VVIILQGDRDPFNSPEDINDNPLIAPLIAPSKPFSALCDGYEKPLDSSLIAIDIGLDTIRQQCQHFILHTVINCGK
jgi:hypothetical protein